MSQLMERGIKGGGGIKKIFHLRNKYIRARRPGFGVFLK
jgi:hypothetical protein